MRKDEKFLNTFDRYREVGKELRNDCIEFLTRELNKVADKKIEWDYDECEELGLSSISIPYDGGNHPEYASDMYCDVWGVFLDKDGKVNFILSECDEYEEDRADSGDVFVVADFVNDLLHYRSEA